MTELPRQSYSPDEVVIAVSSREVIEATRKAAGVALAELGVPLTRRGVADLANRMLSALHEALDEAAHDA